MGLKLDNRTILKILQFILGSSFILFGVTLFKLLCDFAIWVSSLGSSKITMMLLLISLLSLFFIDKAISYYSYLGCVSKIDGEDNEEIKETET